MSHQEAGPHGGLTCTVHHRPPRLPGQLAPRARVQRLVQELVARGAIRLAAVRALEAHDALLGEEQRLAAAEAVVRRRVALELAGGAAGELAGGRRGACDLRSGLG